MKKIISLVLTLAVVFGAMFTFTSCTDPDKNLSKAYDNIIKDLEFDDSKCTETFTVATSPDFAPMEFVDLAKTGDDKYVGFDIILAKYLAKELNMKLVIKPMSFDACMAAVQNGTADAGISGFSYTAERAKNFNITDYYIAGENETEQVLITTKENAGKLTKAEDYTGLKVGAQGGSLQELLVNEQLGQYIDGGEPALYTDLGLAVEALLTGKIDALAVAVGNGEAYIANNPDKLDFSGFKFVVSDLYKNNVILCKKGNDELTEKINAALEKALNANYYDTWYEACQIYSQIKTMDDLGYDENGNKIEE